jgi:ABC-type transporter Mla subunit MlaD
MLFWGQIVLVLCVVAITIALVPALLALRRASERAERLLGLAEQELRPLAGQTQTLLEELREFSHEARGEMVRVGALTQRVEDVTEGLGRALSAVSGLTRAGQLVGVAAGLKTGLDVFLQRLRRHQGENNA